MTQADLKIERLAGESWHDCARRYARKYGLEAEVMGEYEKNIRAGETEADGAFNACMDWDLLRSRVMSDIPMKMLWMGEDIENMPREQLLEIIRHLAKEVDDARAAHRHTLNVFDAARRARAAR